MRFVRRLLLISVVLVVVLAVVAWTLPAQLAYRYFGGTLAPLALRDVGGTVWQGHAAGVAALGNDLGRLDWTLQPRPLLAGNVVAEVVLSGDVLNGHGVVERTADGRLLLHDAIVTLPARVAAPVLAIPMLELLGTIEVRIANARVLGLWPADASGTATWHDAAVAGAAQARLGELQATFASAADGGIAGTVADLGGPLQLAGTFKASLGRYEAQARLSARDNDPHVAEALQFVGQSSEDGSRDLQIRGGQLSAF